MKDDAISRHGGRILADALAGHGVRLAFGVPGESFLPVLDGLYDHPEIRFVTCRQEGGAAYMAEAYGKLTGSPGVLMVTRGPGASNAAVGVHTAFQDSSPLVVFIGQVGNDFMEREAFQEMDYRRMYGPMAKWVAQIDRADRIPEMVSHAFHCAMAGRPGPVVLALPEDMLYSTAAVADVPHYVTVRPSPSPGEMQAMQELLQNAERPLVLIGGSGWDAAACAKLREWIEASSLPTGTAYRCQDLLDNRSPCYAGDFALAVNPKLGQRLREADVVIALGARLDEISTGGYSLIQPPVPKPKLIHVHPDSAELGRVYHPTLAINAAPTQFVAMLEAVKLDGVRWRAAAKQGHEDYLAWAAPAPMPGAVHLGEVVKWLDKTLSEDAIVTTGAGNFSAWVQRHFSYKRFRTQLGPVNGSMGYGLPAAIAAKLAEPQRTVISVCGDGDYLMTGQELATAMQFGAPVVALIVNNGLYGTIRMHQAREFPRRAYATQLRNPDFAAYARSFGAHGETVERTADFAAAYGRAVASGKPALIELRIDSDAISPTATLSAMEKPN